MSSHALVDPAALDPGRPSAVEERIGHRFSDPALLDLALRHRSWCAENGAVESNERLEFLGDSVLGLVVTEKLFAELPDVDEGMLARHRAELVNWRTLSEVAREIDLGPSVRLGRGERATGGSDKSSILSDAIEAVLGAVYLDAGLDVVRPVILRLLESRLLRLHSEGFSDHKSQLQELAAALGRRTPVYRIDGTGPDHDRWYTAQVTVGRVVGEGAGRSKKEAEQAAAAIACARLAESADDHPNDPPPRETSNQPNGAEHG